MTEREEFEQSFMKAFRESDVKLEDNIEEFFFRIWLSGWEAKKYSFEAIAINKGIIIGLTIFISFAIIEKYLWQLL